MPSGVILLVLALVSVCQADFHFRHFSAKERVGKWSGRKELSFLVYNKTELRADFMADMVVQPDNGALELTTNRTQLSYAMWYTEPQYVYQGFNCSFTFRVGDRDPRGGGDGIAFVVQNAGLGGNPPVYPIGKAGMGIGYSGIPKSFAIEFDMYLDPDNADPNANHISAHSRGEAGNNSDERIEANGGSLLVSDPPIAQKPLGDPNKKMDDGDEHHAEIRYIVDPDPELTRIEVYMDNHKAPCLTVRDNIGTKLKLLGTGGYAYVGFTSSTGDNYQIHEILNWDFRGVPVLEKLIPWAGPLEGQTMVVAQGANFRNETDIKCKFGDYPNSIVDATFVDGKHVKCVAPRKYDQIKGWVTTHLSFIKEGPKLRYLRSTKPYYYYPDPNITKTIPLGGPITGGANVTIHGEGFIPELATLAVCRFGAIAVPVINITNTTVQCGAAPALNESATSEELALIEQDPKKATETGVGMRSFDFSLNGQQFTGQAQPFFFYHPFIFYRITPQGGFSQGGDFIRVQGNFTITPGLSCKFNDIVVPAVIEHPMWTYQRHYTCITPPGPAGRGYFQASGNGQQWHDRYLVGKPGNLVAMKINWVYDDNLWIWLICGVLGFTSFLVVLCCGKCWATLWKFKDYRLMASKEYREMTGKSAWQSMRELVMAHDAEERRKTIQVLNMLKMKRKANQPKFSQKSRWGVAAAKALQAKRAENVTGWDALLLGEHKEKPEEPAEVAAEKKPAPGAAWGAIMSMAKDGGGEKKAGGKAASGWAKLAQAPKKDGDEAQ